MPHHWLSSKLKREFHWTKLLFRNRDWRTLAFTPWLPYNWWQVIYVLGRWVFALYYLIWLIYVFATPSYPAYFLLIYLTLWGFILWNVYLVVSALAVTVAFIVWAVRWYRHRRENSLGVSVSEKSSESIRPVDHIYYLANVPELPQEYEAVTWAGDRIAWYQKIQWVLYNMASVLQIGIVLLYWTLLASSMDPDEIYNAKNFNIHMTGGVMAVIDAIISGVPVSIYHMYITFILAAVYSVFSGVYYGAGGLDRSGNPYIYTVLRYGEEPGRASAIVIALCVLFVPFVHVCLYALVCLRRWITYQLRLCVWRKCALSSRSSSDGSPNLTAVKNPVAIHVSELADDSPQNPKIELSGLQRAYS